LEIAKEGVVTVHLNPSDYIFEDKLMVGYVIATEMPNFMMFNEMEFPNVKRGTPYLTQSSSTSPYLKRTRKRPST
jgi:hypothetical protein